jgi:hypothetical protein
MVDSRFQAVVACACVSISSCALLSDFSVNVCEVDADCDVPGQSVMLCEQARCVAGCRDNHHCAERDPRAPLCTEPGGECVSLTSTDGACFVGSAYDDEALGPLTLDDIALVGAFAPEIQSSTWLTLQLGVDEFNQSGGLAMLDGTSRPVLVSVCEDAPERVERATVHLVNELGARAVIAALGADALRIASSLPGATDALWLSPRGAGEDTDGGPPFAWYLQGRQADAQPVYGPLMQRIADARRALDPAATPLRIVIFAGGASEDAALGASLLGGLELDGLSTDTLRRFGQLAKLDLDDRDAVARAGVVREGLAAAPDVVIISTGGSQRASGAGRAEELVALLADAERESGRATSLFVWGPRNAADSGLLRALVANPGIAERSLGVDLQTAEDAPLRTALDARFLAAFPEASVPLDASVYDALNILAFALSAAPPRREPASAGVLEGFGRITRENGAVVTLGLGADAIEQGRLVLNEQSAVLASGVTGPARFDPSTGVRSAAPRAYCWGPDARRRGVTTLASLGGGVLQPLQADCGGGLLAVP